MEWIWILIEAYLIAIVIIIHASLLYCAPNACAFDFSIITLPQSVTHVLAQLLNFIPISLYNLQLIAHFLLLGDIILVFMLALTGFRYILSRLINIMLLSLALCVGLYLVSAAYQYTSYEELR